MSVKMWKCYACVDAKGRPGRPFAGAEPVCGECKIDKRKGPREDGLIVAMETIHFQPCGEGLKEISGIRPFAPGRNEVACATGKPIVSGTRFTGVFAAVTCGACLAAIVAAGVEVTEPVPADVGEDATVSEIDKLLEPSHRSAA
jgi:hypothetical protein